MGYVTKVQVIERRCEHDPAFQWLTGLGKITHHTLSYFRVGYGEALDERRVERSDRGGRTEPVSGELGRLLGLRVEGAMLSGGPCERPGDPSRGGVGAGAGVPR